MMRLLLAALLLAFAASTADAQTAKPKQATASQRNSQTVEQRADEITAGMVKNLRLVPDQAKKLQQINRTSMRHAEEAKAKHRNDPRQMAEQMDIISQTRLSQIKDILTEQQFTQYQSRREEKMGVPKEAQSNPASRQGSYQDSY